jgi:hypothetical protein
MRAPAVSRERPAAVGASRVKPLLSAGQLRLRFGVLCILAYVAFSWSVRFDMPLGHQIASLVYPLDTFSMYAGPAGDSISHLLVRDAQGVVHRVTDFRAINCAERIDRSVARCSDRNGYAYHYDELTEYIAQHGGPATTPVDLIYRTWEVRPGAPPAIAPDCVVAHCTVAP